MLYCPPGFFHAK